MLKLAVPFLVWSRFGDTTEWEDSRKAEANDYFTLQLQAQLNKYVLGLHPFADVNVAVHAQVYLEAKLMDAKELATTALWLLHRPVLTVFPYGKFFAFLSLIY